MRARVSVSQSLWYEAAKAAAFAEQTGVMVALEIPKDLTEKLERLTDESMGGLGTYALPDHMPAESMHLTLAFCGDAKDLARPADLFRAVSDLAGGVLPLSGVINGYGRFVGVEEKGDPFWAHADLPELPSLRSILLRCLAAFNIPVSHKHGFTSHITLAYLPPDAETPTMHGLPLPYIASALIVGVGGSWTRFPLGIRE